MPSQFFSQTAHVMQDELASFHRALRRKGDAAELSTAVERLQTAVNQAQTVLGNAPDSLVPPLEQPEDYQLLASQLELAQEWLCSPLLRHVWAPGRDEPPDAKRHAKRFRQLQ